MAPPTDLPSISEETVEMIDSQVKKGKVRKFFLIYKGASIKSLVVFKKGPFGPKVMQAKKNGFKGDVAYGTVTGSGKNLSFMLPANGEVAAAMKVDSFAEGPPTKTAKLREFLMANGLKFKPEFQMVTEVAGLIDPESDDDAIPTAPPPPGTIPEAPPPPDAFKVQFATRFKRLKPDLDKVVAAKVSVSQDVKLKASEAGVFARKAEFESAVELLDDLDPLIEKGLAEIKDAADDGTAAFKTRLTNLVTRIKAAGGAEAANDAKLKASEANVFARKQDFDQANQLLTEAESILEQAAGAPPAPTPPGTDPVPPPPPPPRSSNPAAEFKQRLTDLLPLIKKAVGTPPGDDAKLKASEANVFARKKEFDKANTLLDEIKELLAHGSQSDDPPPKSVEWLEAKASWQDASDTVDSQIAKLQSFLRNSNDEELVAISEFGMNALTGNFKVPLMAAIREIDSGKAAAIGKAQNVINGFRKHIESSEPVSVVDENPFGVEMTIRETLTAAFSDLESALSSMAVDRSE